MLLWPVNRRKMVRWKTGSLVSTSRWKFVSVVRSPVGRIKVMWNCCRWCVSIVGYRFSHSLSGELKFSFCMRNYRNKDRVCWIVCVVGGSNSSLLGAHKRAGGERERKMWGQLWSDNGKSKRTMMKWTNGRWVTWRQGPFQGGWGGRLPPKRWQGNVELLYGENPDEKEMFKYKLALSWEWNERTNERRRRRQRCYRIPRAGAAVVVYEKESIRELGDGAGGKWCSKWPKMDRYFCSFITRVRLL